MSQKQNILNLLLESPGGVSCREFENEQFGTYHKLASRISDIRKMGYEIVYHPTTTDSYMDARYVLIGKIEYKITEFDDLGQGMFKETN